MTPPRRKLSDVNDGIIEGHIDPKGGACHNCGVHTRVIVVRALSLPEELQGMYLKPEDLGTPTEEKKVKAFKRLIFADDSASCIDRIGIGCGCYAKGHRQIAHIKDRMK